MAVVLPQSGAAALVRPAGATLDNYRFILSYPIFLDAVRTSVLLAAMAATSIVGLTFLMAWIAQRAVPRFGWLIDCSPSCRSRSRA